MQLAGPVLEVWSSNVADPLVADEGLGVLRALAGCPRCLPQLAQHAIPVLTRVRFAVLAVWGFGLVWFGLIRFGLV